MTFISIGQTARLLGVSCTSLRRWDKEGYLKAAFRTRGGHRRYRLTEIHDYAKGRDLEAKGAQTDEHRKPRAVTYARVSAVKQKDDLERQEEHLKQYVAQHGWVVVKAYKDVGSGLNDKRKGLLSLIRDLGSLQPEYLVCRFSDRLSRFGIEIIRGVCALFETKIIITQDLDQEASVDDQLVKDVIALITSFSGKLYRRRRGTHQASHAPSAR